MAGNKCMAWVDRYLQEMMEAEALCTAYADEYLNLLSTDDHAPASANILRI